MGRPKKITEALKLRIEEGYTKGFNHSEVALYADISRSTLYDYFDEHPEFRERCEHLSDHLKMIAKQNIYENVADADLHTSKWYLERKDKEFTDKKTIEHEGVAFPTEIVIKAGGTE